MSSDGSKKAQGEGEGGTTYRSYHGLVFFLYHRKNVGSGVNKRKGGGGHTQDGQNSQ